MGKIDFDELVAMGDEYRATTPLDERIKEVDRIASEYRHKPLLVALIELLFLLDQNVPLNSLRYLPAEIMQKIKTAGGQYENHL